MTVINVVRPTHLMVDLAAIQDLALPELVREAGEARQAAGEALVRRASEQLAAAGKQCRTQVRVGDPASEILHLCEAEGAGLVITGARGMSPLEGLLLGSVPDRLLKGAHCSVLLAR